MGAEPKGIVKGAEPERISVDVEPNNSFWVRSRKNRIIGVSMKPKERYIGVGVEPEEIIIYVGEEPEEMTGVRRDKIIDVVGPQK